MRLLTKVQPLSKHYLGLMKPGIIAGNMMTAIGGYALAYQHSSNLSVLLPALIGLCLVIAAACVCNNYIDQNLDKLMTRTRSRALPQGIIQGYQALIFGTILGILGTVILCIFTNLLTAVVALVGFFIYVVLYSFSKYLTPLCTLIGSLAGSMPAVIGYCAISNTLDLCALLLFLTVAMWQMPHFFAIALYRLKDYSHAGIPVMPVAKGLNATRVRMVLYVIAFMICSSMLTVFDYTGYIYLISSLAVGVIWLALAIQGFFTDNITRWARLMFLFSLVVITTLCATMTILLVV